MISDSRECFLQVIYQPFPQTMPYPDKWIRDIIINFMLAGRDTTATLLTWTTYLLASHPDIMKRVIEEISTLKGQPPTYDDISRFQYLEFVLKESMRLYSPVPGVARWAEKADILPGGNIAIPAGTRVRYHSFFLHRDPKYWDDPLVFKPERWQNQASLIKHSYQYIPFHAGPTACLGRKMAILEAKCMMILLLQNFELEVIPQHSYTYFTGITTSCEGGCPILLKPR